MAMGQAAGTAAAMAVGGNAQPRGVDVAQLRARLATNGALLEPLMPAAAK
jgi:hypothetical protein